MTAEEQESLTEQVHSLLERLRQQGFRVGVDHHIAVTNLLTMLAVSGRLPSDLGGLRGLIAPIVCCSADEQHAFHQQWEIWLQAVPDAGAWSPPQARRSDLPPPRKLKVWVWSVTSLGVAATLAFALFLWLPEVDIVEPPPAVQESAQPQAPRSNREPLRPTGHLEPPAARPGSGSIGKTGAVRVPRVPPPPDEPEPKALEAKAAPKDTPQRVVPGTKVEGATPPDSKGAKLRQQYAWLEQPQAPSGPTVDSAWGRLKQFYDRAGPRYLGLVALPWTPFVLLCLTWLAAGRKRVGRSPQTPKLELIRVRDIQGELYGDAPMRRLSQVLREYRRIPTHMLDSDATVEASARACGQFRPVYAIRRAQPEYLALIDRLSPQDHQALWADELVAQLSAHGVALDSRSFRSDPRHSVGTPRHGYSTLSALGSELPDHRVLMFSDGAGLMDPLSGEPRSGIDALSRWPAAALLSPLCENELGYTEWALQRRGLPTLEAGPAGLIEYAKRLGSDSPDLDAKLGTRRDCPQGLYPALLTDNRTRWISEVAPARELVDRLVGSLHDFLGVDAFAWLCACAVFPGVYYGVTCFVGHELRDSQGQRMLRADRLLALARLPWFRRGSMPDWLRLRLLRELDKQALDRVRAACMDLLGSAMSAADGAFDLYVTPQPRKRWAELVPRAAPDGPVPSPLQDAIFVSTMWGPRSRRLSLGAPPLMRALVMHRQTIKFSATATVALALSMTAAMTVPRKVTAEQLMVEQGIDYWYGRDGVQRDDEHAHQLFAAACRGGNVRGCTWLAESYWAGRGVDADLTRAQSYYDKACRAGDPLGCTWLGVLVEHGWNNIAPDPQAAWRYYEDACEANDGEGCYRLGWAHEIGMPREVSPLSAEHAPRRAHLETAREKYAKGCQLGNGRACDALGTLFVNGVGVEPDRSLAEHAFRRAASARESPTWSGLGQFHMLSRWDSDAGVLKAPSSAAQARAVEVYRKGCDRGELSECYFLADARERGTGTAVDSGAASKGYEDICKRSAQALCWVHLSWRLRGGDISHAEEVRASLQKLCDGKHPAACEWLAYMYERGIGGERDLKRARDLYGWACGPGGDSSACESLGWLDWGQGRKREAVDRLRASCDRGNNNACVDVGIALRADDFSGKLDKSTRAEAESLYTRACERGFVRGCVALAEVLHDPIQREGRDKLRATYRAACDLGLAQACQRLADLSFEDAATLTKLDGDAEPSPEVAALNAEGIKWLQRSCELGYFHACNSLGVRYHDGLVVEKDVERAARFYQLDCDTGDGQACANEAQLYGEQQQHALAAARLHRGCDVLEHGPSCTALADRYREGEGVVQDPDRAREYYARLCRGAGYSGCRWLGKMHADDGDMDAAFEAWRAGCEEGADAACCAWIAYTFQQSEHRDLKRALAYAGKGCDLDSGYACLAKGAAMLQNKHMSESGKRRALSAFERACTLKEGVGCETAGNLWYMRPGTAAQAKAFGYFSAACEYEDALGCQYRGTMLVRGEGTEEDLKAAERSYRKACELEDWASCSEVARMALQNNRSNVAKHFSNLAARHGEPRGMYILGDAYLNKDQPAKAASAFRKACAAKLSEGCLALAELIADDAVSSDKPADDYYRLACELDADQCSPIECLTGNADTCLELAFETGDDIKSRRWYRQGCELSNAVACYRLGSLQSDASEAQRALSRACDLGEARGCRKLADLLWRGGAPFARDRNSARDFYAKAAAFYRAGCEQKRAIDCAEVAELLEDRKLDPLGPDSQLAAQRYIARACKLGSSRACEQLKCEAGVSPSDCLQVGYEALRWGGREERGRKWLAMACEGGELEACYRLGVAIGFGKAGVAADRAAGDALLDKACSGGFDAACQQRQRLQAQP